RTAARPALRPGGQQSAIRGHWRPAPGAQRPALRAAVGVGRRRGWPGGSHRDLPRGPAAPVARWLAAHGAWLGPRAKGARAAAARRIPAGGYRAGPGRPRPGQPRADAGSLIPAPGARVTEGPQPAVSAWPPATPPQRRDKLHGRRQDPADAHAVPG